MPTVRKHDETKKQYHSRLRNESAEIERKLKGHVVWERGTYERKAKLKTYRAPARLSTRPKAILARQQ